MNKINCVLLITIIYLSFVFSSCPSKFFDCGNDRCIGEFWRCDGEDDCGNWADEHNCLNFQVKPAIKECPVNHTHCNDTHNTCVPNKWICDGIDDCDNGFDEKNCSKNAVKCSGYLCHNFECIPLRWRCDGIFDCEDRSDELNCPRPKKDKICDKEHGFYQCFTGECVPHHKVCDNHKDCPQGDDEGIECRPTGCHAKNCSQLCFVSPDGPQCYCREGFVIDSDNTTCVDENECDLNNQNGLCSQTCINLEGSYRCSCLSDYVLVNNRNCIIKEGEPLLLFSNSEEIRGLWLRSGRYFQVYHSLGQTVGIDILGSEEKVFWVDLDKTHSGVYSVDLNGDGFKPIITTGLKSPEDLAIDWIGLNIYITDADMNKIIVCRLDGEVCSSNLFGDLDLPRAIVVNPSQGILFWTEWGKKAGIYRSGMDGSNKVTLIHESVVWPNGLALDTVAHRLYWSEAKYGSIEFYDLNTKVRKSILKDSVFHPFSLAVFEDSLYWSDWITYSLDMSNKFTGHNQTNLLREINEHIMGVKVFHPSLQKSLYNPCWLNMCSHLCLLAPSRQYSCTCPDHLVLSNDNKTCIGKPDIPYLLVSTGNEVKKFYSETIGKDVMIDVTIPNGVTVGDIAFDWKTQTLFVFDIKKLVIGSVVFGDPRNSHWTPLITSYLDKVEGLTYDLYTNNLYWLETKEGVLEVATRDGNARTILIKNLEKPIDLVLYPEHRRMYVAVMGSTPHIMESDMDGENQKVLIASRNGFAVSLAVDKFNQKLFWADPKNGVIEWMELFAGKEHESSRGVSKRDLGHVMSIEAYNNSLFWTDMDSDILYHENFTHNSFRLSKIHLNIGNKGKSEKKLLMAIPENTPIISPCSSSDGGCSHICLLGRFGPTCKCPFGYELQSDGQTCKKETDVTENDILCKDCVTSDYQTFDLGFVQHDNTDEEDLNWFTNEDEEADIVFARYDSKHRVNETQNIDNYNSSHVTNEENIETTEVTTKIYKTKTKESKKSKAEKESNVKNKDYKNKIIQKNTQNNTKEEKILSSKSENQINSSDHKQWISIFVGVLIVSIIILLVVLIFKKDEYREIRSVIFKRGDQIKGAIVNFQNPVFKRTIGQIEEEEEPLNGDNEDKY